MTSKEKAEVAAAAFEDKKGADVKIIYVAEKTVLTEYFVIVSGGSPAQVDALAESAEKELAEKGERPRRIEGAREKNWVAMDYSDVILHIMRDETRRFYDLERLWE